MTPPFPPGSIVVAYLRDSGHEDQDLSIGQQAAQLAAYCTNHHLTLHHTYQDAAAPGSSTVGRDQFLEMIHDFRQPTCKLAGVIVWKFNRFARDMDDAAFYKADLRRRGYTIHSLNDQVPDGLDGRFFESAIDWMNQRYIEDLRADVKRGQKHLVNTYGGLGGTPPRGFIRQRIQITDRRDGTPHIIHRWVPDPDMIQTIRQAFALRAAGQTYAQIEEAVHLYTSSPSYAHFFTNKIYIGILEFSDISIPDYCTPIITPEVWETVQAVQQRTAHANRTQADHPRRKKSSFLLSGLLFCPRCSNAMVAEIVQYKTTAKYRYEYYACSGQNRHKCTAKKIPRAPLERAVIEILAEIVLDPSYAAAHRDQLIADQAAHTQNLANEKTRLNRNLRTTRDRIKTITDLIADGSPPRALIAKLQDLEGDESSQKIQLLDLAKPPPPIPTIAELTLLLRDARDILSAGTPEQLHTILNGLISRITAELDPSDRTIRGILEYYDPLNAYRASHDALHAPTFYEIARCPGRSPTLSHKITLSTTL